MKARGNILYNKGDAFEDELLKTLRGPIVFEAVWSDAVDFNDSEWLALASNYKSADTDPGQRIMVCAARIPIFLRRGKLWKLRKDLDPTLGQDVTACYDMIQLSRSQLRDLVTKTQKRFADGEIDYSRFFQIHYALIRLYALCLSIVSAMGCLLSTVNVTYTGIEQDMRDLCEDNLGMAWKLERYRPLGASIVPISLATAWCASPDITQKNEIKTVLRGYMDEYPTMDPSAELIEFLSFLEKRLRLQD
jgi:hypothetical protein